MVVVAFVLGGAFLAHWVATADEDLDTRIVYLTRAGDCFHTGTCHQITEGYKTTLGQVKDRYEACSFCKPDARAGERAAQTTPAVIGILATVATLYQALKGGAPDPV